MLVGQPRQGRNDTAQKMPCLATFGDQDSDGCQVMAIGVDKRQNESITTIETD